ncbi:hypothetical protein QD460_02905 [Rhizobium jaguaris]|uniref:Uncharacterized protein n=1 Tax=Rhizobium jaguaris TaxID=1312183 RepID=A0A387FZW3_9HYPH|nr:hypothetical protein [Rhizobium jaguaris]AYG62745.1 hypothetical protein CCGE525_28845 [Rhizobium jaguaris]
MSLQSNSTNQASPVGSGSAGGLSDNVPATGISRWLPLAAAPAFAVMALLTAATGGEDMLCSAAHGASPLSGMVPMYLLMSVFHSAPWLRLLSRERSGARRS